MWMDENRHRVHVDGGELWMDENIPYAVRMDDEDERG